MDGTEGSGTFIRVNACYPKSEVAEIMYTYLIADDETLIRQGTIKKLDPISDRIKCIGKLQTGWNALKKAEKLNPDIFLIDMQMPVMDGVELPKIHESYPEKPIIVISGYKTLTISKKLCLHRQLIIFSNLFPENKFRM